MLNHFRQYKTYDKVFKSYAEVNAEYPAIYYGDRVETWKELDERTNALANALLDFGYKKGDNCALLLPNCPEYWECIITGFKTGIIPVSGVNYRYVPSEMQYVIDSTDSKCLILDEDYVDRINQVRPELEKLENCIVVGKNVPGDMLSYDELIDRYPKTDPKFDWEIEPDDICYMPVTGGTTGRPKAVLMRHGDSIVACADSLCAAVVANVDEYLQYIGEDTIRSLLKDTMPPLVGLSPLLARIIQTEGMRDLFKTPLFAQVLDASVHFIVSRGFVGKFTRNFPFLLSSPLFHWASLHGLTVIPMGLGGPVALLPKKEGVDPKEFWEAVDRRKVAASLIVGDATGKPVIDYLGEHHDEFDLSSLVVFESAGAGLAAEHKRVLLKYAPHVLISDSAGSTEALGIKIGTITNRGNVDEAETMKFGKVESDVMRRAVVINPETGKEVGRGTGEVGEICYAGSTALAYYGDAEKTEKTWKIIDGVRYLASGDAATVDADGSIRMYGRFSGIINTGGEKVYAEEVEEVIKVHPKIDKLGITGVPDERWGEAVTAVLTLRPGEKMTEEEVKEYFGGKIARYKIPKRVFFVSEIPMSVTGKAERPKLKYMARVIAEEGRIPAADELEREFRKTVPH